MGLMTLLDDFVSKDRGRILHATWEVFHTRDPEVLAPLAKELRRIDRATDDIDLGGALASNAQHVGHAIERLRLFADGQCLCAAYADHMFYEPAKEESYGYVRIVEEIPVVTDKGFPDRPRRVCECTDCGRVFDVQEGEYHYPWWKWTPRGKRPRTKARR